jgi:hypothetical protein
MNIKRLWIPILVVVTLAVLGARQSVSPAGLVSWALQGPPNTIHGVLARGESGTAFSGGYVIAERVNGGATVVMTDDKGSYSFSGLTAGRYLLSAFAPNQRTAVMLDTVRWSGNEPRRVDFMLDPLPLGRVAGNVRSTSHGRGIAGAQVRLVSDSSCVSRAAVTASDGSFQLKAVPAGRYTLFIAGEGWGATPWSQPVVVSAGEATAGLAITHPSNPCPDRVHGQASKLGAGLDGVEIVAVGVATERELYLGLTDSSGFYQLCLNPANRLYVWARRADRGGVWCGSAAGWNYSGLNRLIKTGLNFELSERSFGPWGIAGRIHRYGRPVGTAWVEARDATGSIRDIAPVWPHGRYALAHLTSGEYQMRLIIPEEGEVSLGTARVDRETLLNQDFDLWTLAQTD